MNRYIAALTLIHCVSFTQIVNAQAAVPLSDFGGAVAFTGYPGGLLFQNAFHKNASTRFLLLKAIASRPDSVRRFELTESQVKVVKALRPITKEVSNDSPDEPTYDPKFYSFLSQSQQDRLMILALHFDGLAALSHKSIADRIGLEPSTVSSVQKIVNKQRDSVVLPNFRFRFGNNPSELDKLRNADFDVRLLVLTNFEIVAVLSEKEREKLGVFMGKDVPEELVDVIKSMAELPAGLDHLHALVGE